MKRFLALFLCFALCLTLLPAASAEDIEIVDPAGADAPTAPLDEIVIEPVGADAPDGPLDEPLIEPVGADAPDGPSDEIVIDAPGGPLDEIALVDEPDAVAPGPDAEIQATLVASGSCGDSLTWELVDDGNLYIRGSGAMTDYTRGTAPWNQYRSQITGLVIYSSTTTIGAYAFADCSNLKLAASNGKSFPSSLTSIGQSAFLSCSSLEYVTIPSGVTSIGMQAFDYCSGMKRMTICGAPTLAYRSLGCANLEEISFIGGVPTFDSNIFRDTTAKAWYPPDNSAWTSSVLQNYGGTLTWQAGYHGWMGDDITWDLNASTGALTLSGSGTNWHFGSSGDQSWYPIRSKVKTASVGSGITALKEYALDYLYNMSSVSLPDTLTEIGQGVFLYDSSLSSIKIPKNVTAIKYDAFRGCSSLTEIRFLGHAPESINTAAFPNVTATVYYYPVYSWTTDNRLNYGGTLTWSCDNKVGTSATWSLWSNGQMFIDGSGATYDYPSDYPGFYGFRDEVTTISVTHDITDLGTYLFYGMNKAKEVDIWGSVSSIRNSCFSGCTSLKTIVFYLAAPSFASNCFSGVTATAYYYPITETFSTWTSDVMQNYGGTITWVCDNKVGDDVTWTMTESTGALTLSGTGPTWDYNSGNPGFYKYFVKTVTVGDGVTTLGAWLFSNESTLTSVTLPDTLTSIGRLAFNNCTKLSSVTIPKGVTEIGEKAFNNCSALTEVRFLVHAPSIYSNAFNNVTATAYYFPVYTWTDAKLQNYGGTLTWSCDNKVGTNAYWMLYESGALTIGGAASGFATDDFPSEYPNFYGFRDEITSATISEKCTRAGNYLFYDLNKLEKVYIQGQTDLGNHCFGRCTALKEIRFCDKAPTISASAFNAVTATAYYLPIVDGGWSSDVTQNYGGTITWVCDNQVGDNVTWSIDASGTLTLTGTGPTWDYSTSSLPGYYDIRSSVKKLTLDDGITTIGKYLFYQMGATNKSVRLPSTLTTIGSLAFAGMYGYTDLTIPENVTEIGNFAFTSNTGLTSVRFLGHAPTIASNAFYNDTATAYYFPVYSWTEDKLQQYSGTLTWVCDDKIGDDVTWYLAENGKLSITGTGATWDFSGEPNFNYFRSEIKTAEITAGVTELGKFLLWGWSTDALEIVVVGPDVATIGANAFSWCTKLTEIRFQGEAPSFGNNCFYNVTATAYYPMDDPTWTEDVMQDYGGDITWVPYGGYDVTVANYTKGKATTSLVPGLLYSGVVTFTVTCDQAVVVAQKTDDGYTLLKCTTEGGVHRYTVVVSADTVIAVAIRGDTNLNGSLEMRDATLVSQVKSGAYSNGDGLSTLSADINGNGRVETRDATLICQARNGSYVAPW